MSDQNEQISFEAPKPGAGPPPSSAPGETPTSHQPVSKPGIWQPPTPEELQREIPQYKVLDLLGRGGMGAVYKGWQTSLDRYVAIKILPPGLEEGGENFSLRFKNEAKTMARLSHPGIVGVIDAGETAVGLLYFVMEFIEGTDVAQMIKSQGKLQPDHALAIAAHVCDALGYAHSHGVIHRDIKPANIMLNMDGAVKVADFGLAKAVTQDSGGLTRASVAMGTPDFIAPEALISGMVVDQRADLFAVGVMLYQMLTGKVPRGMFDPPSVRVPGVDKRFDVIVARAMKEEREQRYQSAAEMRRDLDVILTTPVAKEEPRQREQAPVRSKPVMRGPGAAGTTPPRSDDIPVVERGGKGRDDRSVVLPRKSGAGMIAAILGILVVLGLGAFFALRRPPVAQTTTSAGAQASQPAETEAPPLVESFLATARKDKPTSFKTATKDKPFVNTLGMKFVPVPILSAPTANQRVLFGVWDVRVQDYAAYAAANKNVDGAWKTQDRDGVPAGREPDHPVVGVSWEDTQRFCQWLTEKEIAEGKLPGGLNYRLPSDEEWSWAVGLPPELGATPEEKRLKNQVDFPWGKDWPPLRKVGNYADEAYHGKFSLRRNEKANPDENLWMKEYTDGYTTTSPVGSFPANAYGLYDMGGNVWQWCEDWWNKEQKDRVLRGASWSLNDRAALLSSGRIRGAPGHRGVGDGFRCVVSAVSAR